MYVEKHTCFCTRKDSSGKQLFSKRSEGLNLMPYMEHWIQWWKAIDMCSMWGWHDQICIYDNVEDELMGQNLRQRNKPESSCNRTAQARTKRGNTWKRVTNMCEGWGENNLPYSLHFWRRAGFVVLLTEHFPTLTLLYFEDARTSVSI